MAAPPPRQNAHLRPGADVGISVSACLPAFPVEIVRTWSTLTSKGQGTSNEAGRV
ncbi:hypothetical protein B0H14DRAFT_3494835 [Mycena olivaceomarginata]|nr:hypothetical protein B0H14DRAFT_3494835 [Mycena olivaceomarginata]